MLSIKLKLVTGYVLLVTLFIVVLLSIYYEHNKIMATNLHTKELSEQRRQTEQIAIRLLDLSFQGEQMVGIREDELETYKGKKDMKQFCGMFKNVSREHSAFWQTKSQEHIRPTPYG